MCKSMWTLLVTSFWLLLLQPLLSPNVFQPLTSLSHLITGIFALSSLQNLASWERLKGQLVWINVFRSSHNISIGLRSGLWLGQSRVRILFLWSHSFVVFPECFGSLSCCMIDFCPSFNSDWWQEIIVNNLLIDLRVHCSLDNMELSRSRSRKAAPDLHISTTMLQCWEEVLFLIHSVGFSPNMLVLIVTKQLYFRLICPEDWLPECPWLVIIFLWL